ncbi:hypothetical protein B6N60_01212 [Richelia sinica FACHB-800]|uniref:DUF218 domain-containing protein n=1 Tax=Richelia sinica FACHB-800 TaxID=1357546 RepID=A0A975Y3V4_9NOST|nr:ElyC/SanA/YdcF family protein [Richelia sinica]MBD2664247.1 YdcF family protein [Richelia sinica FACHB-800]QXE22529.1 hypothetical protein B6N60_01212 [Richelia sinica FACHB-800]
MKPKFTTQLQFFLVRKSRKLWQLLHFFKRSLCLVLAIWLIYITVNLIFASSRSVDALFVLGGSIRREIYVAQLSKQFPQTPILISSGSKDPCIWLIFQREAANSQQVWLESCAKSTFDNFYYGIPILQAWKVKRVKLITSAKQTFRATLISKILFSSHGIWVDIDDVQEIGVPGNKENLLKTMLDLIRSLGWAVVSQFIQPQCSHLIKLVDVDLPTWERRGFNCEHQGGLGK